ncbi:MAG: VanZ family protein [Rhodothermales bacterium]|jgi:VanZ family protein
MGRAARIRAFIKRWALPFAILWTLGTLSVLLLPGEFVPESSITDFDKLAHFILFGGFAGLWMVALGDHLPRATLYVIVLGMAYGIITEIGQELAEGGRQGDPWDAVADTVGILAGVLAFRVWRRIHPSDAE